MSFGRYLTIDVEDWFHICEVEGIDSEESWRALESRVEESTHWVLMQLDRHQITGIFFVLGWVAERYPKLILEIKSRGHLIGCHSYAHRLLYELSEAEFKRDLQKGLNAISSITGEKPVMYRAPGFSIKNENAFMLRALAEEGIEYDFSIYPGRRAHGGIQSAGALPRRLEFDDHLCLIEMPVSVAQAIPKWDVGFGGGYFRLLPLALLKLLFANREYQMSYFHPRDFDPRQPRLQGLGLFKHFKTYVGLKNSRAKFRRLLNNFKFDDPKAALINVKNLDLERVKFAGK